MRRALWLIVLASIAVGSVLPKSPGVPVVQDPDVALGFIRTALDIIQPLRKRPLVGDYALFVPEESFVHLSADSDLGPFIACAKANGEDRIVILVPADAADPFQAVFFKSSQPTVWTELTPGTSPEQRQDNIESARKPLKPPFPKGKRQFDFQDGNLQADDGTPVQAFLIMGGKSG